MKKLIALVLAVVLLATFSGIALAAPPGAPTNAKMVYKFNYIATPNNNGKIVGCGEGHRVFTERGSTGQILWSYVEGGGIGVDDCMTASLDGDNAEIHADLMGVYEVYVRLHGPNKTDNTLHICRDGGSVYTGECLLGEVNLSRKNGQDRITFPKKLFDDAFENELWTLDPGNKFRIAEIRLYEPR